MTVQTRATLRAVACAWLVGLAAPWAHAISGPYLQIGDGRLPYVYRWTLPDGTVLKQGMTDNHGRAPLVRRAGVSQYLLETTWGIYPTAVPERCWKLKPEQFAGCVTVSPREDSASQKQEAAQAEREEHATRQHAAVKQGWADALIPPDAQEALIREALSAHRNWMKTPAAALPVNGFACRVLDLPAPSAEATQWFDRGRALPRGIEQEQAYVEAAQRGHWRAAARLASLAVDDEDWESAQPAVAWLLKSNIPAGFAKLAEVVAATASYDGARMDDETKHLVTTLRWRAASLGDPVAQSQMGQHFDKAGQPGLALELLTCAQRQNPDIR